MGRRIASRIAGPPWGGMEMAAPPTEGGLDLTGGQKRQSPAFEGRARGAVIDHYSQDSAGVATRQAMKTLDAIAPSIHASPALIMSNTARSDQGDPFAICRIDFRNT